MIRFASKLIYSKPILFKIILFLELAWDTAVFYLVGIEEEYYCMKKGRIHFDLSNYIKAIEFFEKSEAKRSHYESSYAHYNSFYLGYSNYFLGNHKESIQYFERLIKYESDNIDALYNLIESCLSNDNT